MTEITNKCKEINYMYSKPMSGLKLKLIIWQIHGAMIKIEKLGFLHAFVIISLGIFGYHSNHSSSLKSFGL